MAIEAGIVAIIHDANIIDDQPAGTTSGSITGNLAHSGTVAGFYGITPISRPVAYTQTYDITNRTHLGMTAASSASPTLTLVSPLGFSSSAQLQAMSESINNLVVDMGNVKQVLNSILDDLQALGLLQ